MANINMFCQYEILMKCARKNNIHIFRETAKVYLSCRMEWDHIFQVRLEHICRQLHLCVCQADLTQPLEHQQATWKQKWSIVMIFHSSLHNIIQRHFRVVLVLWRLLTQCFLFVAWRLGHIVETTSIEP